MKPGHFPIGDVTPLGRAGISKLSFTFGSDDGLLSHSSYHMYKHQYIVCIVYIYYI